MIVLNESVSQVIVIRTSSWVLQKVCRTKTEDNVQLGTNNWQS